MFASPVVRSRATALASSLLLVVFGLLVTAARHPNTPVAPPPALGANLGFAQTEARVERASVASAATRQPDFAQTELRVEAATVRPLGL